MYQSAWKAVTPGTHDAGTCKAAKANGGSTIGSLDATGACGGALVDEQFAIAGNRELNPVAAVETADAIGIVELGLDQVGGNPRESQFGRLSPMFGLIFEGSSDKSLATALMVLVPRCRTTFQWKPWAG